MLFGHSVFRIPGRHSVSDASGMPVAILSFRHVTQSKVLESRGLEFYNISGELGEDCTIGARLDPECEPSWLLCSP